MKNYMEYIQEGKGVPNIVKDIIRNIEIEEGSQILDLSPNLPLMLNLQIKFQKNSKESKYHVNINYRQIINSNFQDIKINLNVVDNNIEEKQVREALFHELTHLYELYRINRIINNDWEKQTYITDFKLENSNIGSFKYFLDVIYISFDHEIRARIAQLYQYILDNYDHKKDKIEILKNSRTYQKYLNLKNFDFEKMILYYKGRNELKILMEFVNLFNQKFQNRIHIEDEFDLKRYFQKWKYHFNDSAQKYYQKMFKVFDEVKKDYSEYRKKIQEEIEYPCNQEIEIPQVFETREDLYQFFHLVSTLLQTF